MAKVSQDHLDARRMQILDAARRAFVRNGFHATSMQDILREADLSAGAVYRYFSSKDEIVIAIARGVLGRLRAGVETLTQVDTLPPLAHALDGLFRFVETFAGEDDLDRLVLQVWAEAIRSPEIRIGVQDAYRDVEAAISTYLRRYQDAGELAPDADTGEIASFLLAVNQGFVVQHALFGRVDTDFLSHSVRTLMNAASLDARETRDG